jgi:hypothetical protein
MTHLLVSRRRRDGVTPISCHGPESPEGALETSGVIAFGVAVGILWWLLLGSLLRRLLL